MTDKEYRELLAELAGREAESREKSKAEADRQMRELRASQAETGAQIKELRASQQKTDRQIEELGRKIGGLGEKFGGFTEGMAFPSMERVLRERFKMEFVSPRVKKRKNGRTMELDVFAYSNSRGNEAVIVEVKSRLREEGLDRLLEVLREFPRFFPEHREKRLFGILACVDAPEHLRRRVLRSGIHLAEIHDETFRLRVPDGFVPKSFQN